MSYATKRPLATLDVECYRNYFLVKLYDIASKRFVSIASWDGGPELDIAKIRKFLRAYCVITFNGNSYDMPMVAMALTGANCSELKDLSDRIILTNMKPWDVEREIGVYVPGYVDHIDLIEVAPGQASLKLYAGRIHSRKMQDLPIEPDALITVEQRGPMSEYCGNDLVCTADLYDTLRGQVALRERMSDRYGMDLRSKSDAQIAEAVIIKEVENATGRKVYRPDNLEPIFNYTPPGYIKFDSPIMRERLRLVRETKFVVSNGKVDLPKAVAEPFELFGGKYRMGIGGLHSMESSVAHFADDDHELIDKDVGSYYPNLIRTLMLYPRHIGEVFIKVYTGMILGRMAAKKRARVIGIAMSKLDGSDPSAARKLAELRVEQGVQQTYSDTYKIVLNSSFGKFGSRWSKLFSPNLLIQTTVTGQLALLMLIERLGYAGITVISANTDGVVSKVPVELRSTYETICFDWEIETGLSLEATHYSVLASRDVNNYLAVTTDGKVKRKGVFERSGLKKAPQNEICNEAVIAYLTDGTDIRDTIESCDDIRKFLTVRRVNGGALKDGELVGKAIRWYYAEGERGCLVYKTSGNTVPRTDGAMPLMELPDEFPDNVDYDWYVREAYGLVSDIGITPKREHDPAFRGRKGYTLARLPTAKNIHTVDLRTGVALCGAALKGRHDRWVEYPSIPDGHRDCAKCRREAL